MTIVYAAAPGSASNTFVRNLEIILNCKSKTLKSGAGIGHLSLSISAKKKILKKLKLDFLDKTPIIYGHIFPSKFNLDSLNNYYNIKHTIISYRNIYEQLNYSYKWQKYHLRSPLNFLEDTNFSNKDEFNSGNFNIDLNLLLCLNFYKHWFYLIQNNKIKNYTLFSFDEIISVNEDYKKKINYIFKDLVDIKKIKFNKEIRLNIFKKEQFEINPRHQKLIDEFISFHKEVDFTLIV
tara:strand:+ start:3935 stop:4642 length:708 start_codon:yes stop_codon:yes gene_type:complete